MLYLAIVLFWTFVIFQFVGIAHGMSNMRFNNRREESIRIIEDSPYFQHLGMRPPKPPVPIRLWMISLAIWGIGVFVISTLNL